MITIIPDDNVKIRQQTFETNSSSMHSLCLKKKSEYFTLEEIRQHLYIKEDGILIFDSDELEFDRSPFTILSSFLEKLRYLFASYSYVSYKETRTEIINIVKEIIPECKNIEFPLAEDCLYLSDDEDYYYGYIDHESSGLLRNYLERNNIAFKEFLLNKKYFIIIDGDEYQEWNKLKKLNLIDTSQIESEICASDS